MSKIHKNIILFSALIFLISISLVKAQTCTCSNCSDCSTKLNNASCNIVELTADIINQAGTCISTPANFNNKIFDCQGHTIDGDDSGTDYGIYLNGKSGNTIRNCMITDFNNGIYLFSSPNNNLTNNTANSNSDGIYSFSSLNNILTDNTANSNTNYGIYLYSSNNNLTNNTANSNYRGIGVSTSLNNILTDNTANSNTNYGIYLYSSSNNTVQINSISNNSVGIYSQSSNSIINMNNVCGNINLDLNSSGWLSSSGDNNTCNNPDGWNDIGTTGCTYSCVEDVDGDGIPDSQDNCINTNNANQYDSNQDGYGNKCDPDVNNDGSTNLLDANICTQASGSQPGNLTWNPDCDFNEDGVIDLNDIAFIAARYGLPPGPSYGSNTDGDGWIDKKDNCQYTYNPDQSDRDIPEGMVSYWKFDEGNGTAAVDSVDANDGTLTSGPLWIAGQINSALQFNGTNYVQVSDDSSLDFGTGDFSIEAWIKPTDVSTVKTIIDKRSIWTLGYVVYIYQGKLGLGLGDGTYTNYIVPANMSITNDGKWHFMAVAVQRNGTAFFYVDGNETSQSIGHQGSLDNSGNLLIGGHVDTPSNRFKGGIDEVAIYNKALTQEEVQQHHQNSSTGDGYMGEGVGDVCDNCWYVSNSDQLDTDGNCPAMPFVTDPKCGDSCEVPCSITYNVTAWVLDENEGSGICDIVGCANIDDTDYDKLIAIFTAECNASIQYIQNMSLTFGGKTYYGNPKSDIFITNKSVEYYAWIVTDPELELHAGKKVAEDLDHNFSYTIFAEGTFSPRQYFNYTITAVGKEKFTDYKVETFSDSFSIDGTLRNKCTDVSVSRSTTGDYTFYAFNWTFQDTKGDDISIGEPTLPSTNFIVPIHFCNRGWWRRGWVNVGYKLWSKGDVERDWNHNQTGNNSDSVIYDESQKIITTYNQGIGSGENDTIPNSSYLETYELYSTNPNVNLSMDYATKELSAITFYKEPWNSNKDESGKVNKSEFVKNITKYNVSAPNNDTVFSVEISVSCIGCPHNVTYKDWNGDGIVEAGQYIAWMDGYDEEASEPVSDILYVSMNYTPPSAYIDSIDPNISSIGENVSFSGYGKPVNETVAYWWRSHKIGRLGIWDNFTTSKLPPANPHFIYFYVKNTIGLWSSISQYSVKPLIVNNPPLAFVNYIKGHTDNKGTIVALANEDVEFNGYGIDTDGFIQNSSWFIEGQENFSLIVKHSFSNPGTYNVIFRVQDNVGMWSKNVSKEIIVVRNPVLLVHDYLRSPKEMDDIKEALEGKGYNVYTVDLRKPVDFNIDVSVPIKSSKIEVLALLSEVLRTARDLNSDLKYFTSSDIKSADVIEVKDRIRQTIFDLKSTLNLIISQIEDQQSVKDSISSFIEVLVGIESHLDDLDYLIELTKSDDLFEKLWKDIVSKYKPSFSVELLKGIKIADITMPVPMPDKAIPIIKVLYSTGVINIPANIKLFSKYFSYTKGPVTATTGVDVTIKDIKPVFSEGSISLQGSLYMSDITLELDPPYPSMPRSIDFGEMKIGKEGGTIDGSISARLIFTENPGEKVGFGFSGSSGESGFSEDSEPNVFVESNGIEKSLGTDLIPEEGDGGVIINSVIGDINWKDAVCYKDNKPKVYEKSQAVAYLYNGGNCTAWRAGDLNSKYMMTASHCFHDSGTKYLKETTFSFNYQNIVCGVDIVDSTSLISIGAKDNFVTREPLFDYALVELNDSDNRADEFSPLEIQSTAPYKGQQIYIPQHPRGNPKKIAFLDTSSWNTPTFLCSIKNFDETYVYYTCDTDHGSSGSPVIDALTNKVIAMHVSSDGFVNIGVRMDKIWPEIEPFIDSCEPGVDDKNPSGGGKSGSGSKKSSLNGDLNGYDIKYLDEENTIIDGDSTEGPVCEGTTIAGSGGKSVKDETEKKLGAILQLNLRMSSKIINLKLANHNIESSAKEIGNKIDEIQNETGIQKVDIVGSGMGALAARHYVNYGYDFDVRKLVSIGASYHGSDLMDYGPQIADKLIDYVAAQLPGGGAVFSKIAKALLDLILGEAAKQMVPHSTFIKSLNLNDKCPAPEILGYEASGNDDFRNTNVQYHIIEGIGPTINDVPVLPLTLIHLHIKIPIVNEIVTIPFIWTGDLFTSTTSARLDDVSVNKSKGFDSLHWWLAKDNDTENYIINYLPDDPDPPEEEEINQTEINNTAYQIIGPIDDSIDFNTSFEKVHNFTIDSLATNLTFSLQYKPVSEFWNYSLDDYQECNNTLDFYLRMPNQIVITPKDADNVTIIYLNSSGLISYTIQMSEGGTWGLIVNSTKIDCQIAEYSVFANYKTNLFVGAFTGNESYEPGNNVTILAYVQYNGTALNDTDAKAYILRFDNFSLNDSVPRDEIVLYDDGMHSDYNPGDGIYANNYTASYEDAYSVEVISSINLTKLGIGNGIVQRSAYTSFFVELLPDLTLNESDISLSPLNPNHGDSVLINATIHNIGKGNATNAEIEFRYDNATIGFNIINFSSMETKSANISWNSSYGNHTISVIISPFNEFTEKNYSNNKNSKWFFVNDSSTPVADAGPNQVARIGTPVFFDASMSSDNDKITNYTWDTNNDGVADLFGVYTSMIGYDVIGVYVVNLSVHDAAGNRGSDSINVTVVNEYDEERPVSIIRDSLEVMVREPVQFSGEDSNDNYGIAYHIWDIDITKDSDGDMVPDNDIDLITRHPLLEGGYYVPGTYVFKLTVNDVAGNGPVASYGIVTVKDPKQYICLGDKDCDGVYDTEDNCIDVYNPDQKDYDKDGIGDKCYCSVILPYDSYIQDEINNFNISEKGNVICLDSESFYYQQFNITKSNIIFDCLGATIEYNGTGDGITLNSDIYNVTVQNCYVTNNSNGFKVMGNNNKFKNNEVIENANNGFDISGSGGELENNKACSNGLYDIKMAGVYTGDDNTCNQTSNWNDQDSSGCTFACLNCTIPENNMNIVSNTVLCPGEYELPDGIHFGAFNVTVKCDETVLIGNSSPGSVGVKIYNFNNAKIRDCEVMKYDRGIEISNSLKSAIVKNKILENNDGIHLYNSARTRLDENMVFNNLRWGLYMYSSSYSNITKNIFTNNLNRSVVISGISMINLVRDNVMTNGLNISGGVRSGSNTIINNQISFALGEDVVKISENADNNEFIGNDIYDGVLNGFNITSSGNVFTNNHIHDVPRGFLFKNSNATQITGGIIEETSTGIYVQNCTNMQISGINASDSDLNSVYLNRSSSIQIYNNTMSDIYLEYSSYNKISGNKGSIFSFENSSFNNITNNHCNIDLHNSSSNNILNNNASGNDFGIVVESSFGNSIINNNADNNEIGIVIINSSTNIISNNGVCYNIDDFSLNNSPSNSGDNNICNKPDGWNDTGTTGCTYSCDIDNDNITNTEDNCWYVSNPDQLDSNHNCPSPPYYSDPSCGDACEDTPPVITILSPVNKTYYSSSTPLTFTVNEPTSLLNYSLDNKPNVTITGNIILTGLENGGHNITVYAKDMSGNIGSSNGIYFTNKPGIYDPWETSYITTDSYPAIDIEEYNNKLYWASDNKLYVFNLTSWNVIDAPTNTLSLQNYTNRLYVTGSDGKIYSYDGSTFTEVFNTTAQYAKMLGNFSNRVYAGTYLAKPAKLYYYDGINWQEDTNFSSVLNCPSYVCSIDSMVVNGTKMYVSSGGNIYRYDGTWSLLKTYDDVYSFNDMKVYNNKLYLATRDQSTRCPMYSGGSGFCGRVIEYNGTNWSTRFDYSYPTYNSGYWMYSLEVYNGRLYAGTANKIYMYDGSNWNLTFNSLEGAQYALVLKTWGDKIYVGFGNGVMFKDDMLEPKPDLIIDDIWTIGNTINYRIKNQGLSTASSSYSNLYVDNSYKAQDSVLSLAVGSSNEYFSYSWTCSAPSDTIKVCADANSNVFESDENNNCLTKAFTCPVQTCTCTSWRPTGNCCTSKIGSQKRTCTPAGCAAEQRCSGSCIQAV